MDSIKYHETFNLSVDEIIDVYNKMLDEFEEDFAHHKTLMSEETIEHFNKVRVHNNSGLNVMIDCFETDVATVSLETIEKYIDASIISNKPLRLYIHNGDFKNDNDEDHVQMNFKNESIDKLKEINEFLKFNNQEELKFIEDLTDSNLVWPLEDVIESHNYINMVVNRVKQRDFSPLEAICYLHIFTTQNFRYKEVKEALIPRSIVGIIIYDAIVCVGYSRFIKAVINKLNMNGLRCDNFSTVMKESGEKKNDMLSEYLSINTGHMQNLIYIDDEKYNVHGRYIEDATWDSLNDKYPKGKGFARFMFPVTDLLYVDGVKFEQYSDSIDEMLAMINMDVYEPQRLRVVEDNIDNSIPIPYETIHECLKNVYRKTTKIDDEEKLEKTVNYALDISKKVSTLIFTDNAINSIRVKAKEESK